MKKINLERKENNMKGITLVSLVITIIILLILATVSISLVINNGILDKANSAVNKYSEGEIEEQIKLAYLELQTEKLYNSNVNDDEFLTNSLKEKLNDQTLLAKVKNGKVTVNTTLKGEPKTYKYNDSTGKVFLDVIDYGNKTEETVAAGNDIFIGTEKFKVFSKTNTEIKAMPYYNLVTITADGTVKQGPAVEVTSTEILSTFSTSVYWTGGEDAIDMDDTRNNIQQYITEYKSTLKRFGAEGIQVRVGKKSELSGNGVTNLMSNPGKNGDFWTCSGTSGSLNLMNVVVSSGAIGGSARWDDIYGVRPIIVIEY